MTLFNSAPPRGAIRIFLQGTVFLLFLFAFIPLAEADPVRIRIAMVTPEGSAWTEALHRFSDDVARETGDAVRFEVFAGGVSGDEVDVLRKMQANRLQAAGLSGVGLGVIHPDVRVLEAPMLFESHQEIDHVQSILFDRFADGFHQKGYVLLGFAEAGFVYLFSKSSLTGIDRLNSARMWAWKGDPMAQSILETFGIRSFPLHVGDVNTGLETGMIDAFYSPPLAAISFQWFGKIGYMLDFPIVHSTGALLVRRQTFESLTPEHQAKVKSLARNYCGELVRIAREQNAESITVLKENGIVLEKPIPDQARYMAERSKGFRSDTANRPYSKAIYEEVENILADFRRGK